MDIERQVVRHYGSTDLERNVLAALKAAGKDVERLSIDDLSELDEFHLGWRAQTAGLADRLKLTPVEHLLDIGCGIGGPARYCAARHGCEVTGLDLTPSFISLAKLLTERCDLSDKVAFREGSALAMPFTDASFDAAIMIHVGMNIADKPRLFGEARRALKNGGRFAVYDVMLTGDTPLAYPMPWSEHPETSFVAGPAQYREWLAAAGFRLDSEINQRDTVLQKVAAMRAQAAQDGPPLLGLHVIMGPQAKERLKNVMAALEKGLIAPVEMILRAD
ncbi:class I SAM-dependent methyltransferase [Dongia sp.]|uniref:class I SAM-dependent methyltransferase n=1 Tax=Dongia sp. TaxID=1977262 RepID=UPI0035B467A1